MSARLCSCGCGDVVEARGLGHACYQRARREFRQTGVWSPRPGPRRQLRPRREGQPVWFNPWAGHLRCHTCGQDDWTLPWDGRVLPGLWRCLRCHLDLRAVAAEATEADPTGRAAPEATA